jgi:hypothetical protein
MMMTDFFKRLRSFAAAALIAGAASAPSLAGQYIGGDLNLELDESDDVRIFAADVNASGTVRGDVFVAAADVQFEVNVGQDLTIAAADINMDGVVSGDAELFGASVSVMSDVLGDLEIGGADVVVSSMIGGESEIRAALVVIEPSAHLAGGANIAAREVYMEGRSSGRTELRGAEVHISGVVEGPLEVYAREVFIDDSAVITGPVTVRSPNRPNIDEGAQVGELEYIETRFDMDDVEFDGPNIRFADWPGFWAIGGVFASSAFILGVFIALLFPRSMGRISERFRARPWVSGGLGLILYATFWLIMLTLAVLLVATVVGILLAPLVILATPIMYFLAFVFGGVVIGDLVFNRSGGQAGFLLRVGSLAAVMLVITALHVVPPIGILIGLIVNCIGFGAWTLAIFDRQKRDDGPVIDGAAEAV